MNIKQKVVVFAIVVIMVELMLVSITLKDAVINILPWIAICGMTVYLMRNR